MAIVNVASTASRVSRPGSAAYSASKFALIGWSDGLHVEEAEHGVHVGVVLPGFIRTEGFPAAELPRFMVSEPPIVADAIWQVGPGREGGAVRPAAVLHRVGDAAAGAGAAAPSAGARRLDDGDLGQGGVTPDRSVSRHSR